MTPELQILQVLLIANFVLGLVFIYYLLNNRDKRAATSLLVLFVGLLVWLLADIIQVWTPANPAPPIGTVLRLPGADTTIIGLLLFAFEYTGREDVIRKRVLALLSIKPIVSLVVVLTPMLDGLVQFTTPETVVQGYQFVTTPFFVFHITYNWILTGLAIAILVRMTFQLEYQKYRQLAVLFTAFLIPIGANVLLRLNVTQIDLTTAAFFVTATALMYATFRLQIFNKLPVARRAVLEKMDDLVFVLDETGAIVMANSAASELFDDEKTLVGTHISSVLGADTATLTDTGERQGDIAISIDGELRYFTVSQTTLTDYYESVVGQLLVCRDVTERKRRERELEALSTRLELALDETNTGVWEANLDAEVLFFDEASERLYGYAPGEFPNTVEGFIHRLSDADFEDVERRFQKAVDGDGEYSADFRVTLPDGSHRWIQARGVVQDGEDGSPQRMVGIQTDITTLKRHEQRLEEQNSRLMLLNKLVRHDIRNQANLITTLTSRLNTDLSSATATGEYPDYVDQIAASSDQIIDLTQQARDLMSVISSIGESLSPIGLSETLDREIASASMIDMEATIRTDGVPDVDVVANELLGALFRNLLTNAIKHTDSEAPEVVVSGTVDDEMACVTIADNGPGIPVSDRETVFIEGKTLAGSDGTGFGLSLVKTLVEQYGGSVTIGEAEDLGGAAFTVRLPLAEPTATDDRTATDT